MRVFWLFIALVLISEGSVCGEDRNRFLDPYLNKSPRLEYLQKNLKIRMSSHKLLASLGERVSNPLLIRDNILFGLDELEVEQEKFLLLKDLSDIIDKLQSVRNRRQLTFETEKEYLLRIDKIKDKIDPQANLWIEKENSWWQGERDRLKEEENLYLTTLKDKLKITDTSLIETIAAGIGEMLTTIKPGFKYLLTEKKSELVKWQYSYFEELNNRYPGTPNFINISSDIPYIFFSIPLSGDEPQEIYPLLSDKELLDLRIERLENFSAERKTAASLFYALKKKESISTILNKIKEGLLLSSSFEDLATIKKLYLDTLEISENIALEINSLKRELLQYGSPLNKDKFDSYIPVLSEVKDYALNNSLLLKENERELKIIRKLLTLKYGSSGKYLGLLGDWRDLLFKEKQTAAEKLIMGNWYSLVLSKDKLSNQTERAELARQDYELSLSLSAKTAFDKKLKEIQFLTQNALLLDQEKVVVLNFLNLKASLKSEEPPQGTNFSTEDNPVARLDDLKNAAKELTLGDSETEENKKGLRENLLKEEFMLLEQKSGKVIFSDKSKFITGNMNFIFTIRASQNASEQTAGYEWKQNLKDFINLKNNFSLLQKERVSRIDNLLRRLTEKRIKLLERRVGDEENLLNKFRSNIYLDSRQLCIDQKIRILRLKDILIETEEVYLTDTSSAANTEISLNPYQEKLLLEKLSPIFGKERPYLINQIKEEEAYIVSGNTELRAKYLMNLNKELFATFKAVEDVRHTFSAKNKIGLVSEEDLSQIQILKDDFSQELFLLQRGLLYLKKMGMPLFKTSLSSLNALEEKNKEELTETILTNSPHIKLLGIELNKFASSGDINFLKYLKKEKEQELGERLNILISELDYLSQAKGILRNQIKAAKQEFLFGIEGLKHNRLWLYGAYGFNSILAKYTATEKELNKVLYRFRSAKLELSALLNTGRETGELNYQSVITPEALSKLKKLSSFLKERYLSFPALNKERSDRINAYRLQNYSRKAHALNFYNEEKKRAAALKEKNRMFERAREREFYMSAYLDKLWREEEENRTKLKNSVRESGMDISQEVSSLIEALDLRAEDGLILELFFIRYAKIFGKEKLIKKYVKDIASLTDTMLMDLDKLPSWWAKYTSTILFYPEKSYLEEAIDPRILGVYLYYAQLKEQLAGKSTEQMSLRIRRDAEFLCMDLRNIPENKIEPYLIWESGVRKELDQITLSQWTREDLEEKREFIFQYARGLFGSLYGSFKDRILQEEVVTWLISSGIAENEYPRLFEIIERIYERIKEYYVPLSRQEKLNLYEAVRLRKLLRDGENEFFNEEENKLEEATLLGTVLSLAGFFWENKIDLSGGEDNLFFSFTDNLKMNPYFEHIFGKYSDISYPQKAFYLGSLNYWVRRWLEEYRKEKNSELSGDNIEKQLKRFGIIYSLLSFQKLYGPFNLAEVNLESAEEKRIVAEFTGKIGFFSSWMEDFSITDEEAGKFFNNLYEISSLKYRLEKFYQNQGINLTLDIDTPRNKEESLGILISWLQFFNYRGINGKENISAALSEIEFIQQKSLEYGLGFNMDEIRYWWEKIKLKDYALKTTEELFKNISLVKELVPVVCQDLLKELNSLPLLEWEDAELRGEIVKSIVKRSSAMLSRQEIHYFAEKVMPMFGISFEELKKEFREKIYIEAAYSIFAKKPCSPQKSSDLISIMKDRGYGLFEMGNFIRLGELIKGNAEIRASNISDVELYGLLNYIFGQPLPYDIRVKSWINTASVLEKYFSEEHGRFLDFSVLSTLINLPMTRYRTWQIKRYVDKGFLSKRSPDKEIEKTDAYSDFKRLALRIYWENSKEILSENIISVLYKSYLELELKESEKSAFSKKVCEKISLFKTNVETIVSQLLYENNVSCENILSKSGNISQNLTEEIIPYLIKFSASNKDEIIKKRADFILERQGTSPLIKKNSASTPFEQKRTVENILAEKAKSLYGIELAPHKLSALAWKVFEGLHPEEVLKIYIKDYGQAETLYKEVFALSVIGYSDTQLIQYFAEEINMGLLSENFLKDILAISASARKGFKEYFGLDVSIQESLDYAWPIFYSGVTADMLKDILKQASLVQNKLLAVAPKGYTREKLNNDILYLFGQIYAIQLTDKLGFPFTLDSYVQLLESGLKHLNIEEREINKNTLKTAAENFRASLIPPASFINMVAKTDSLHNFVKNALYKELPKKDILNYLDRRNKGSLSYFSLAAIYYPVFPSKISEMEVKILIDLAFKKFLDKNLNRSKGAENKITGDSE